MEDIDNLKIDVDEIRVDSGRETTVVRRPEGPVDAKVDEMAAINAPKDKRAAQSHTWRDGLYDRINVSVKTMDIIIWTLVGLIILALLFGIISGHGSV